MQKRYTCYLEVTSKIACEAYMSHLLRYWFLARRLTISRLQQGRVLSSGKPSNWGSDRIGLFRFHYSLGAVLLLFFSRRFFSFSPMSR